MANVSRIFVRGLPPNMNENEFKIHFSKSSPVTDARLIPHRRIGYLGYKSSEAADCAVKYYNKTFIRMSKILVELAKPVTDMKSQRGLITPAPYAIENERPKARREESGGSQDPKFQEFLQAMQPPSRHTTWANEDSLTFRGGGAVPNDVVVVSDPGESDGEYEPAPKRRKRSPPVEIEQPDLPAEIFNQKASVKEVLSNLPDITIGNPQEAEKNPEHPVELTSDADWLRSRKSRLLGLVENNDSPDTSQNRRPSTGVDDRHDIPRSEIETSRDGIETVGHVNGQLPDLDSAINPEEEAGEHSIDTCRLFIRNMPYDASAEDLRQLFSNHGIIEEAHISTDARTGISKGFAYVQFADKEAASRALKDLDGRSFQGRLLHILPAAPRKGKLMDDYALSKLSHKKQQLLKRKMEASSATFRWNSLYMGTDAIMSSISDRLGVSKSEVLDPTSSNAAIKQAHAEAGILQEAKAYFASHGVNIDSFKKQDSSDTVVLVKNFCYGTTTEEIREIFEAHGSVQKLLMPPSGTIAIVELENPGQARAAFAALAYRRFKESVLFLEKAPKTIFEGSVRTLSRADGMVVDGDLSVTDLIEGTADTGLSSTLFVRNLNFSTTSARLQELFRPLEGFLSAKVKTKTDPRKAGQVLSMGFGFVEFRSKEDAQAAMRALNGYRLDGHDLLIKSSHKAVNAADEKRKEDMAKRMAQQRTKIIIKNLPFEITKQDVRELFGTYGKLRSVRVPKKLDSSTRGFAFADFITAKEAQNAMNALMGTHLLGRRLNLEFAAEDALGPEDEIEKMSKKVGRQADKVALQELTSGGRKKFTVINDEEDD